MIAGIAYLGLGIFSRGISGGVRALDIILGILFVFGGIAALSSPSESTVVLGIFLGIFIGVLWIIEASSRSCSRATRARAAGRSSSAS